MSEATEQREIVKWFREVYPNYKRCLRVSNGGVNFGYGSRAARKYRQMQSQGYVPGESDIAILVRRGDYGCFLMEYKSGEGQWKATDAQQQYVDFHNVIGNCAVICKGVDAAKAAITQYMAL